MSRGKDFREPRRRGFDDDNFGARDSGPGFQMPRQFGGPPRPAATGPIVDASVLQRAGIADLAEGQRVTMQVVEGMKGREAASIAAN